MGALLALCTCAVRAQSPQASSPPGDKSDAASARAVAHGRQALAGKRYMEAAQIFRGALRADAQSVPARMGLADAELALHQYGAAEMDYRRVVAAEPQMWVAHKNLVIVEAELGRWEEFDRERAVLRGARERGADGISARESDVIDGFDVRGQHWIVREYFEPVGQSLARFNFESFTPAGRAREYISLERWEAAKAAQPAQGDRRIDEGGSGAPESERYALNWYTGKAHGLVRLYGMEEPDYEHVRADVLRWLRKQGAQAGGA